MVVHMYMPMVYGMMHWRHGVHSMRCWVVVWTVIPIRAVWRVVMVCFSHRMPYLRPRTLVYPSFSHSGRVSYLRCTICHRRGRTCLRMSINR